MTSVRRERLEQTEIWTIVRPAARNAIDVSVLEALEHYVAEATASSNLSAVVLLGEGGQVFVSGADLKQLRTLDPAMRESLDGRMLALLAGLAALPVPVLAAINGQVLGGGCELVLACDLRIAESHATFTFKHAAMGVSPGWGGLARLTACVGRGAAARLLLTAEPVSAAEALRIGLADELVDVGHARARALELASAIAQLSPTAVAELKRLLALSYADDRAAVTAERSTFAELARGGDHAEALAAYFDKRAPRFGPRRA